MRPTGLGHGVYKDKVDYAVFSGGRKINPSIYRHLRWSIDDFLPLIKSVQAPLVLVAHPSVPASSFAEFVTWPRPTAAS
jgi:hypothetical protein